MKGPSANQHEPTVTSTEPEEAGEDTQAVCEQPKTSLLERAGFKPSGTKYDIFFFPDDTQVWLTVALQFRPFIYACAYLLCTRRQFSYDSRGSMSLHLCARQSTAVSSSETSQQKCMSRLAWKKSSKRHAVI